MTQNSKEIRDRSGWRGPNGGRKPRPVPKPVGGKKPSNTSAAAVVPDDAVPSGKSLPLELQQLLLNIFKDLFPDLLKDQSLPPLLQEVKAALFDRDFARAFGEERFLEAYAVRWSPGRALGYAECLVRLGREMDLFETRTRDRDTVNAGGDGHEGKPVRVVCLGGGAAEVIAFGGLLRYLVGLGKDSERGDEVPEREKATSLLEALENLRLSPPRLNLHLVDSASWSSIVQSLSNGLVTPPPLPKYASASARASNVPLLPSTAINTSFQQSDILGLTKPELTELVGPESGTKLITLLFTLNELYSSSIAKTTALLLDLTELMPKGAGLLVVDSAGSYAEAALGKETDGEGGKKRYPMSWLMDRTLLGQDEDVGAGEQKWKKVVEHDSTWFRLLEGLKYPIGLENMRYQVHLFRRL